MPVGASPRRCDRVDIGGDNLVTARTYVDGMAQGLTAVITVQHWPDKTAHEYLVRALLRSSEATLDVVGPVVATTAEARQILHDVCERLIQDAR
jgi:hypothetical protein